MSWSNGAKGTPAEVVAKLEEYSGQLTGDSKTEFDEALPFIRGLVLMNTGDPAPVLEFSGHGHAGFNWIPPASGEGHYTKGEKTSSECCVTVRRA